MKHASEGTKLKVVLDTNVYVSAFTFPQGSLFAIWRHARIGTYRLLVSPAIVRELAYTLRGPFAWTEPKITRQLKLLVSTGEIIAPAIIEGVARDPSDNHILGCAIVGGADLIVTGDRDLLHLKSYQGIGIVRPADFLRTLGGP